MKITFRKKANYKKLCSLFPNHGMSTISKALNFRSFSPLAMEIRRMAVKECEGVLLRE